MCYVGHLVNNNNNAMFNVQVNASRGPGEAVQHPANSPAQMDENRNILKTNFSRKKKCGEKACNNPLFLFFLLIFFLSLLQKEKNRYSCRLILKCYHVPSA